MRPVASLKGPPLRGERTSSCGIQSPEVVIRSSVMSSVEPNRQGACTPPVLQAPRNRTGGERVCSTTSDLAVMGWRVQRGAANQQTDRQNFAQQRAKGSVSAHIERKIWIRCRRFGNGRCWECGSDPIVGGLYSVFFFKLFLLNYLALPLHAQRQNPPRRPAPSAAPC